MLINVLLQMKVTSEFGEYQVDMTTFQMCVLFQWRGRMYDELSFAYLQMSTDLPCDGAEEMPHVIAGA